MSDSTAETAKLQLSRAPVWQGIRLPLRLRIFEAARRLGETSVTELLVTLAREGGLTVVVATHQPRLVARADRVLRLDHGLVTEESR